VQDITCDFIFADVCALNNGSVQLIHNNMDEFSNACDNFGHIINSTKYMLCISQPPCWVQELVAWGEVGWCDIICSGSLARTLDTQLREPGLLLLLCQTMGTFFQSTLIQFTNLYEWVRIWGYRSCRYVWTNNPCVL